MTEFKVPELGENVTTGDVLRVLVNPGDTIARDQPVIELETEKATIEVPSSVAGVVKDIKVKPGDKVQVGAVILTVDENGAGGTKAAEQPKAEPAAGQGDQKVVSMPRPARTESAPAPRPAEPPRPPELPKPVATPPAPHGAGAAPPHRAGAMGAPAVGVPPPRADRGPAAPASPGVRRLAREIGVDVNEVVGTGPQGRISEEDVKEHARRVLTSVGPVAAPGAAPQRAPGAPAAVPLPDFTRWGEVERQPMSNIRRTTSMRLSHAWNAIPHVTQFDKADITGMEELRRKYREQVRQAGGDLTVTAMLVKVLAVAVKQFPQFNAALDLENDEIVYKKYVNVGIAVDTDRGLLVPVIRNADRKNLTLIAIEVHQLAERARERKLTLEEMSGGGITISNLGGIGGTYFTPIVNWPEVAILGVSRGIVESVWRNEKFEPRQLLPLSLSYDHRVIDGADAMRFLRWVVEAIEQPFLLSLLG
ncbi:MAG: 2-oxo acid dehydrogenase subunit E2 [Acidobacteria bacterium]|nr:2-oxo acid dehydrogenase subunit E2 [Acidobacteriota bacterium]